MPLPFAHFISSSQITPDVLSQLFVVAEDMEKILKSKKRSDLLNDAVIATLFYEPSTRSMLSFQSAAQRLGASTIAAIGKESSSMKKGESIEDTIKMVEQYSDLIVMRHPQDGAASQAAAVSQVPFINAGDGGNEHPTQALLDAYTIYKEKGSLENLHIAFGFDPKHSRTIRSLAAVLSQYKGNKFTFVSPESLRVSDDLKNTLKDRGIEYEETTDITPALDADILYTNRLQEERFTNHDEFEKLRHEYCLTVEMLKGKDVLLMNPLPRIDEIDVAVDDLDQAKYFEEAGNGVPARMALMAMLLGKA